MVDFAAWAGNLVLIVANFILNITSILLSYSIKFTLSIGQIYTSTPAIQNVWVILRNISSMFIIFMLLFTSIQTILNIGSANLKGLVVKIIIAGLLINFSLFFTKVLIDASNLISMQFYRAVAPNSSLDLGALDDGGLSAIFLASLSLQKIYHPETSALAKNQDKSDVSMMVSIAIATFGGAILMIFATISFLGATIAFTIRTGFLLILMAFSPLFFAGMIFPKIKAEVSDKWRGYLTQQLLFMPIYLLLLYVSMRIISDPKFLSFIQGGGDLASNKGSFLYSQAGIVIQYVIAIFFINLPLLAAIKFGAVGAGFADDLTKGLRSKLYKAPKAVGGWAGRNTAGRMGGVLGSSFDKMAARAQSTALGRGASSVLRSIGVSQAVRGGFGSMEKSKYGGKQNLEDIAKENKERARIVSGVQRTQTQSSVIGAVIGSKIPPTVAQIDTFRETVGKMSSKEIEKLDFKTLKDPIFAANLSSSQTEKILDGDSLTEQQKEEFKTIRKDSIKNILSTNPIAVVEKHMKILSGKELSKMDPTILGKNEVLDQLTPSQLQDMRDANGTLKTAIGNYISGLPAGSNHRAIGYIRKNRAEWS